MQNDEIFVDDEAEENAGRQADSESEIEAEEGRAEGKIAKMREEIATLRKEKQENMDGWQRAKADYVNALKRFEEEKKVEKARGVAKAVEALLPAYDAIERAKEHGDIPEGFQAIVKQLEAAFASLGLTAVGEVGEAFDPVVHEAYGQDPVTDKAEDDTITAVLEKGWKQGDTVLRPAKVRVGQYQG
jgi:molecular chaperone GrpE